MILLKMAGALSFPAEHDEDFSVRFNKWCPSCRAIDQNVTPRKPLLPSVQAPRAIMLSRGDILIYIALDGWHHFYNSLNSKQLENIVLNMAVHC
jgi:thiol-disulfide isomerase/thioredoxin